MNEAEIASRRQLAWESWKASQMKAINRQFKGFGLAEIGFYSLSIEGRMQIEREFEEWWHPL